MLKGSRMSHMTYARIRKIHDFLLFHRRNSNSQRETLILELRTLSIYWSSVSSVFVIGTSIFIMIFIFGNKS